MSDTPGFEEPNRGKLLVHLGNGRKQNASLPAMFGGWRELRVDADPKMAPDLLADVTDLSAIESGSADAVWLAHCLEHLYLYQVSQAIAEVFRILAADGFLCLIVPDLQAAAEYITQDRLHEVVYQSPAGPVTAHDIIFGFGPFLAQGHGRMAHRCGFTPGLLVRKLQEVPFAEIIMRRRPNQELAAVARKRPAASEAEREALLQGLEI